MSKTDGAKSTPGLTDDEMATFIATWIEPYQPTDFEGAMHKLMAVRAVRALATPNNERLAQLLDKLLRARWRIKVAPRGSSTPFRKPGDLTKETA